MAITSAICDSYRGELVKGTHNLATSGDTIMCSLYLDATATLNSTTTAYTATGEHATTGTYVAKGKEAVVPASMPTVETGGPAWVDLDDVVWASSTITDAGGCLLYNDDAAGDESIQVHSFGADYSTVSGTFTVQFPAPGGSGATAIIRVA